MTGEHPTAKILPGVNKGETMPDTLIGALAKAQSEMSNAAYNKVNPHFRNRYADLAAIRDATVPALSRNGLAIIQYTRYTPTSNDGGTFILHTRIAHSCGEFIEGTYPLPTDTAKPQVMGSALTYAKRYCWASMCGIAADEDDDANAAQGSKAKNSASEIAMGEEQLSKSKSRPIYDTLIKEMRLAETLPALTAWGLTNSARIHSMHDEFQKWFRQEYQDRLTELREGVNEEGETLADKLRASLESEA